MVLAPPCGESRILSLVKTSRKDSKLRGLTRLSYSLDLRKDEMKTGDYPTLRRVFRRILVTDWMIVSANQSTRKPNKDSFLEGKVPKMRILKLKRIFKKRSMSMETLLSGISRTHMIIYLSRYLFNSCTVFRSFLSKRSLRRFLPLGLGKNDAIVKV